MPSVLMLRKIKTPEQMQKKKHRDQIIVGTAMIFLLTISVLGYSLISNITGSGSSVASELGLKFVRQNGLWKTTIGNTEFGFQNLPSEVSNVSINGSFNLTQYLNKPMYFVNPNENYVEVLNNIGRYALRYQEACIANETCNGDLPTKTCDDNLIIFKQSEKSAVYQYRNCVYILGDSTRSADAFLYKVLGIN